MDCQIWETGSGAGVSAGPQSVTHECIQVSRRRYEGGRMGFLNVQGMRNKQGELGDLLKGQNIGVLVVAET